jgi:hypothetical protein
VSKHIGSTIAMVLGGLMALTGVAAVGRDEPTNLDFMGVAIFLGAIAYRSAKQRHLGNSRGGVARLVFLEMLPLFGIVGFIFGRNDLKLILANDPAPIALSLLAVVPYLLITFRSPKTVSVPSHNKGAPINQALKPQATGPVEHNSSDDDLYAIAGNELDDGVIDKGVWTRLLVESNGDGDKTKINYLKYRFSQLVTLRNRKKAEEVAFVSNTRHHFR